jgi:hypothetical protein
MPRGDVTGLRVVCPARRSAVQRADDLCRTSEQWKLKVVFSFCCLQKIRSNLPNFDGRLSFVAGLPNVCLRFRGCSTTPIFWTSILLYFNFFLSILLNFIDNVPKHVLKAGWQRWSTFGFIHLHSIVMYNILAHWVGLARFRARMFCALSRNIRFKIRIAGETRKQKCTTRANLREIVNNNVAVVKGTAQVRTSNEDR